MACKTHACQLPVQSYTQPYQLIRKINATVSSAALYDTHDFCSRDYCCTLYLGRVTLPKVSVACCWQVMENTVKWMHRGEGQQVYRARFSAITAPEIRAAMVHITRLDPIACSVLTFIKNGRKCCDTPPSLMCCAVWPFPAFLIAYKRPP